MGLVRLTVLHMMFSSFLSLGDDDLGAPWLYQIVRIKIWRLENLERSLLLGDLRSHLSLILCSSALLSILSTVFLTLVDNNSELHQAY